MPPADGEVIAQWLTEKRRVHVQGDDDPAVRLVQPADDETTKAMALADSNAFEALRTLRAVREADKSKQVLALQELQNALGLETPPGRIECYDISTLQGTNTVGSMVVFAEGTPRKSDYRRFKIRGRGSQGEPDDFASMREMLRRRFRRAVEPQGDDPGAKARQSNAAWAVLPDLVIVDGGKGQLGVAVEVLKEFDLLDQVPVVGLAKQREELFQPGQRTSILLPRDSEGLYPGAAHPRRDPPHRHHLPPQPAQQGRPGLDAGERARHRPQAPPGIAQSLRGRRGSHQGRRCRGTGRGAWHDPGRGAGAEGAPVVKQ